MKNQKLNFKINENEIEWSKNVLRYYYNLNKFKLFTKINDLLDYLRFFIFFFNYFFLIYKISISKI